MLKRASQGPVSSRRSAAPTPFRQHATTLSDRVEVGSRGSTAGMPRAPQNDAIVSTMVLSSSCTRAAGLGVGAMSWHARRGGARAWRAGRRQIMGIRDRGRELTKPGRIRHYPQRCNDRARAGGWRAPVQGTRGRRVDGALTERAECTRSPPNRRLNSKKRRGRRRSLDGCANAVEALIHHGCREAPCCSSLRPARYKRRSYQPLPTTPALGIAPCGTDEGTMCGERQSGNNEGCACFRAMEFPDSSFEWQLQRA